MKTTLTQFVKYTALSLCVCAVWSCSSKDELEDMLSKETTPVTFRVDAHTAPIFFDYTEGWRYIGSDTVRSTTSQATLNLHQGKHNIVAVKGVSTSKDAQTTCIHFNPDARTFSLQTVYKSLKELYGEDYPYEEDVYYESANRNDAFYWHRQLEVSPYLPEQQPDFQPVTATLQLTITDYNNKDIMPGRSFSWLGEITDIPVVEEVGIEDDKYYKLRNEPHQWNVGFSRQGEYGMYPIIAYQHITLCPLEGLNDITLSCTMFDEHDQAVPTTPLPRFSLRRGYTTVLTGPLFSGSASDWTVEMTPY